LKVDVRDVVNSEGMELEAEFPLTGDNTVKGTVTLKLTWQPFG
jgi:hypothetical protein